MRTERRSCWGLRGACVSHGRFDLGTELLRTYKCPDDPCLVDGQVGWEDRIPAHSSSVCCRSCVDFRCVSRNCNYVLLMSDLSCECLSDGRRPLTRVVARCCSGEVVENDERADHPALDKGCSTAVTQYVRIRSQSRIKIRGWQALLYSELR